MSEQEKISDTQYTYLVFIIVVSTIVLYVPQVLTKQAGQSAWLVPLFIPPLAGFSSFAIALSLSLRFPGMSFLRYTEIMLGKAFAKTIGIVYLSFFLMSSIAIIREYTDFTNITMLPNTPRLVLVLTGVVIGSYAATKRLEVIARAAQFVLPLFLGLSLFILLLSVKDMDPSNVLPLFEGGFAPIIRASIIPSAWFGQIGLLVLFFPVANQPKAFRLKGSLGIVLVSLFISIVTAATIMVLGSDVTESRMFPLWSLSTYIESRNYFHRVESFLVLVYLGLIYIKIALFSYLTLMSTVQTMGLKSLKKVQLFIAVTETLAACFFLTNITDVQKVVISFLTPFGLGLEIVIPMFLLIVCLIKKRKKG